MRGFGFVIAALTVVAGAGAACENAEPGLDRPGAGPSVSPGDLTGSPIAALTGLRLLLPGRFLDVDAAAVRETRLTGWLPRPGRAPLLVDEVRRAEESGPVRVSTRTEPGLPGSPTVVRIDLPSRTMVAAARDDAGLWLAEFAGGGGCSLRLAGFDGGDRRAARPFPCDVRPIAETPQGLWVTAGPGAFTSSRTAAGSDNMDSVLLDPETLTPRLTVPHAEIIDQHRFLRIEDDRIKPMRLHDLRSEQVVDVPRPPHYGWTDPRVSQVSPDGRWLGFTFADPGRSPQVMDVWLLDLSGPQWTRAPAMPTRAALKATDIAFAPNGRLVMLGRFGDDDNPRELLATWRPGEPQWALLPLRRPEPPPGQPVDTRFLVL